MKPLPLKPPLVKRWREKFHPVSSTKGATGHMMGAGGVTEFITCIQAIHKA